MLEDELHKCEKLCRNLESKNIKLREMPETILMKLEDYHKYGEPEKKRLRREHADSYSSYTKGDR